MRHWLSRMRSYFIWDPLIWLYTIVLGALSLLSSFFDRDGRIQHRFARLWSKAILGTIGARVTVTGLEAIDTSRAHVYVVNHLSALDIPLLYVYLPFQFRILAKRELFHYPFMGWHLGRSGQIPVDLDNPKKSIRSLNRAVEVLKKGMPLVIFPEGGRSEDGQLQAFMGGAFFAAIKAQIDVVPMAITGTYEMLKMNTWHIKPRPVRLTLSRPVSTDGLNVRDTEMLTAKVRQIISEMIEVKVAPGSPMPNQLGHEPRKVIVGKSEDFETKMAADRRESGENRPRIAIPEPSAENHEYSERSITPYLRAVEACGGEPVVIPLGLPPEELAKRISVCSGVLLPGSDADVDPQKFNAERHPKTEAADPLRDAADELLLQDAYNLRKPIFGICYGPQSLNVWRTGSLVQHIESKVEHSVHDAKTAHHVVVEPNSLLAQEIGRGPCPCSITVNSSHHQAADVVGDGLRVAARCPEDGVVEAIEGTQPGHTVLAVQWHPERDYETDESSRKLFEAFVDAARQWHAAKQNDD